jgi:thiamine pyrophosphate-dependent acetolactate synthase large subunit-like protein
VQLPNIDFCCLADSLGVGGTRVTRATDLNQTLIAAFRATVPVLVEVQIE